MKILGTEYNNQTIDGQGTILTGKDCLFISSIKEDNWKVPENIVIRNFIIKGSIRIMGMGINGQEGYMKESSRNLDHTERCQSAAPKKITFENIRIEGEGRIPFYIAPGCTEITLRNSELKGRSDATAIYLDCESARNTIENNIITTETKREAIAVDGSAYNLIKNNTINSQFGGIYLYRNSGEGGVIRHQPPIKNKIENNTFTNIPKLKILYPPIWVGSRSYLLQYFYRYRNEDIGYPFGSSINNSDLAKDNLILNNHPNEARIWES